MLELRHANHCAPTGMRFIDKEVLFDRRVQVHNGFCEIDIGIDDPDVSQVVFIGDGQTMGSSPPARRRKFLLQCSHMILYAPERLWFGLAFRITMLKSLARESIWVMKPSLISDMTAHQTRLKMHGPPFALFEVSIHHNIQFCDLGD